jgi:hypothetical protein
VRISFTLPENSSALLPATDGLKLLISIDNASGEKMLSNKEISFTPAGSAFTTEALELTPGNYVIKDFVLTNDKATEIVYAAPKANSSLALRVQHPLMDKFQLGLDRSEIVLELFAAVTYQPKDFGYTSYRVRGHNFFNVVVNLAVANYPSDASPEAFILDGMDTVQQYVLDSKVNHLSFDGDMNTNYTLVVVKDGYSRYSYPFTMESLEKQQHKNPIQANLSPAFTLVAVTNADGYFIMEVDGYAGDLMIDWGDGVIEPGLLYTVNVREHIYEKPGRYFVSITGDLTQVNTVAFRGWGASETDRINTENLPSLINLQFEHTPAPTVVDVSHNEGLALLYFWSTDVEQIKISSIHPPISGVEMEGSRYVTTASIDAIIDAYYNYALSGHSVEYVFISWSYTPDPVNYMIIQAVGPPSPSSLDKMRILQNTYGVDFAPDVDYAFGSGEPF